MHDRKNFSKSAPDNRFNQSLKNRNFKNTGKQGFFTITCFDDKFLRILFFRRDTSLKESEIVAVYFRQNANKSYDDHKTKNDF